MVILDDYLLRLAQLVTGEPGEHLEFVRRTQSGLGRVAQEIVLPHGRMRHVIVRDHTFFAMFLLLKKIVQPFALQPARKKVEVRFLVLGREFAGLIRVFQAEGEILFRKQASLLQHVGQKSVAGLVQKDLAVAHPGKPPEPRTQYRAVGRLVPPAFPKLEDFQHSVERQVPLAGASGQAWPARSPGPAYPGRRFSMSAESRSGRAAKALPCP